MVRDSVIRSVIQNNGLTKYACYFFILAAVVLVSCQKASERAESSPPSTAAGSASAQSETEIPSNTVLWVQLKKDLDSSKLKVGDTFTGELAEAVVLNGKDVVPKKGILQFLLTEALRVKA